MILHFAPGLLGPAGHGKQNHKVDIGLWTHGNPRPALIERSIALGFEALRIVLCEKEKYLAQAWCVTL